MNLQDAIQQFDTVTNSDEKKGRELTEEPPGQTSENIETPEARREVFSQNLRRRLQEGHLGTSRRKTR